MNDTEIIKLVAYAGAVGILISAVAYKLIFH